MEELLELVSAICLVAASACALGSLVIGVRAWTRRMDDLMDTWLSAASLPPRPQPARTSRLRAKASAR
jgi:hypothetical protein